VARQPLGLGWALGDLDGTADVSLTDPQGNAFTQKRTDNVTGGSDLYGLGTLK